MSDPQDALNALSPVPEARGSSYVRFSVKPPKAWRRAVVGDIDVSIGPGMFAVLGVGGVLVLLKVLGVAVGDNDMATALKADASRSPFGDTYGVRFHNQWRTMNHDQRMAYRKAHGKEDTWMPPGYPAIWD